MPDLNSLALFAKVMEANGFSEAARRLRMPLSTVSRRIGDLERELGVRLIERSTRRLRLTEIGAEVLEHARRSANVGEAVDTLIADNRTKVAGVLRISSPPSISDSLLAPLAGGFQASYPDVRILIFVTERLIDPLVEGVDLVFRIGGSDDRTRVAQTVLSYRIQLVASPAYLAREKAPQVPQDLTKHRLFAFSRMKTEKTWHFTRADGSGKESLRFRPYLTMNDYAGLAKSLVDGAGIGDLPPVVQPDLLRTGKLVEVMPKWHMPNVELSLVRLEAPHVPRLVRLFTDFTVRTAPTMFPDLPI